MAPSAKTIEKELRDTVRAILRSHERDLLTVNFARQRVQQKLKLEDDFLKTGDWAVRSKNLIHKILEDDEEDATNDAPGSSPPNTNNLKRQSSEEPTTDRKRVKKEASAKPKPVKKKATSTKQESDSDLSDLDGLNNSEEERPKGKPRKPAAKKKQTKLDSESELSDLGSLEEEPMPKRGKKSFKKQESDSELSDLGSTEEEGKHKKQIKKNTSRTKAKTKTKRVVDSDEEAVSEEDLPADRKRKRGPTVKKPEFEGPKLESDDEDTPDVEKIEFGAKSEVKETSSSEAKVSVAVYEARQDASKEEKPEIATKTEESKPMNNDGSSELSSILDDDDPPPKRGKVKGKGKESKAVVKAKREDDSSELSSILDDDEPPPKKKRMSEESKGESKPKPKNTAGKATKELTGDEAEIKKLQSNLVKCGIRKIWAFELKDYGDDSRAKIRHLKKMLSDVGMDGRFSEAKAKQIKERRELMADLEAVQAMDRNWGAEGRSGRASRSKSKATMKEPSDDESGDDNPKPRVSKRMADLAFLGDESESE